MIVVARRHVYERTRRQQAGRADLQGVVHQAHLYEGVGLLAVAPQLGQQQQAGPPKVQQCQYHNQVHCYSCCMVNAACHVVCLCGGKCFARNEAS